MSTITVTNIKATGETASRAVSGVAAAWVNYKGTSTNEVRDSQNISSVTDNNSGDYILNFSSNMGNANYCFDTGTDTNASNDGFNRTASSGMTTSTLRVLHYEGESNTDLSIYTASVTGDLA